ncbi:peroxisome assembly protein (Peroxin-2), variant 6 [Dermatophagoides farinae]|uniref:Peroxisome assembly protein (Peroxin-2), variant 6 n=1 Tax=Dermatophagoides farinae TaxID=6954 RepID=A0A922HK11_DERFA|nr:peroxisome assembly protein (Peroxin-2), variant 6 [Dermatophagoides farinae]
MIRLDHQIFLYFFSTFSSSYIIWFLWNPIWFNHFCIVCGLSIISWTLAYYFFEIFNQEMIDPVGKIVLITGCDSGFGNRLACRLDRMGFHIYAGVLLPDGDGAKQLQQKCSNRLKIMQMDVTKPEEVNNVVEQIKQSGMPLWALVNNAGIGISVPFDWGNDIDVYRKVFDVNIFGVVRVTKSCISLLRQSNGRIVNVASLAARITSPLSSHYSMAKHSVRVFSDALRREIGSSSKMKIITLEPSFYRTDIINHDSMNRMRRKIFDETPEDIRENYGEKYFRIFDKSNQMTESIIKNDYEAVIEAMIMAVAGENPKLYYRCCNYYEVIAFWALSHMPEIIVDYSVKYSGKLNKLLWIKN